MRSLRFIRSGLVNYFRRDAGTATLRRLLSLTVPYKGRLALATACLLLSGLINLAFPYALRILIDSALVYHDVAYLNQMILFLIGAMLVGAIFDFIKAYHISYVGERVITNLRKKIYAHLQRLSVSYYDEHSTGQLMSHITNDAAVLQGALSSNLIAIPQYLVTLIVGIIMIVIIDWRLALYLGGIVPALLSISWLYGRPLRRVSRNMQEELSRGITVVEESLALQRIVKAFAREDYEINRFGRAIERFFNLCLNRAILQSAFGTTMWLCISLSLAGLFWYGGHEVMAGRLTPGGLISFILYMTFLINPVSGLGRLYADYQQALGASDRIFALLDTEPAIEDASDAYDLPAISGAITIKGLAFAYQAKAPGGPLVLRAIDLSVEPGETVAIVGASGAGKTTLVNLIPRFYEAQAGSIQIDGHDITKVTQRSLRNALAMVPQDPILFSATIRENIAYGQPEADQTQIEAAATAANAHEFICGLEGGYETVVGERGVKLSGGQRQRIAIARALIRNPRVLILDEATSSLDNESEYAVQQALEHLMAGRTTLVIAHRLTTIERADKIIVLNKGELVEVGTHAELLARGGIYHRFYLREFARDGQLAVEA